MSLVADYGAAVVRAFRGQSGIGGLLPVALAEACVAVLPIAGAGLSVMSTALRVPLSASDDDVSQAELLQTTLGEGPCLAATGMAEPVVADLEDMAQRWPSYHAQLVERTPFRSVASIPLSAPHRRFGALDLYSTDPQATAFTDIVEIQTAIADQAAAALVAAPTAVNTMGISIPIWLETDLVSNRLEVWIAIGILVAYARLNDTDSLAVLRAYAFGHDTTLDDVSRRLISGELAPSGVVA